MILPIRIWPDPVLSVTCAPVVAFDAALARLADDMLETMYDAPGRGLAAPQVGVDRRLFVMDVGWEDGTPDPMVCVNPGLAWASDDLEPGQEGCLSIPDTPVQVVRPVGITLTWQDLTGAGHRADLTGAAARCAQHELDHLNGVVIFDRISPEQRTGLEAAFLW